MMFDSGFFYRKEFQLTGNGTASTFDGALMQSSSIFARRSSIPTSTV